MADGGCSKDRTIVLIRTQAGGLRQYMLRGLVPTHLDAALRLSRHDVLLVDAAWRRLGRLERRGHARFDACHVLPERTPELVGEKPSTDDAHCQHAAPYQQRAARRPAVSAVGPGPTSARARLVHSGALSRRPRRGARLGSVDLTPPWHGRHDPLSRFATSRQVDSRASHAPPQSEERSIRGRC